MSAEVLFPEMDPDERRRWLAGRDDWESDRWEDHCGDPGCDHSCCAENFIPEGCPRARVARRLLVAKLGL